MLNETKKEALLLSLENQLKAKGSTKNTIKTYRRHNTIFLNQVQKDLEDINQEDIKEYFSKATETPSTLALKKSALKSLFHNLLQKDIVKINTPKVEKSETQTLSNEEVKTLIEASKHEKSKLIMKLLYSTGLKVSELTNLRLTDINLDTNVCWIKKDNRARDRTIKFPESLLDDLKKYLGSLPQESEFLLSSDDKQMSPRNIQKIVQRTSKRAKLEKTVTPSILRQSYSSHLLAQGVDVKTIKKLLGYSNSTQYRK